MGLSKIILLSLILLIVPFSMQSQTFEPIADSYVRNDFSSTNFGTISIIASSFNVGQKDNRFIFLKFNLHGNWGSISNAKLRLYGQIDIGSDNFTVYAVSDTTWGETTITYDNQPILGPALQNIVVNTTTQWWEWSNITSYIQQEINSGHRTITLAIRPPSTGTYTATFNSREATFYKPELIVTRILKTWDGGAATSNWGDNNNWNPDGVPLSSDDVNLTSPNTINVNVSGVCNNLTLNNADLVLTINTGSTLSVSSDLTINSGKLNIEQFFPTVSGTKYLIGGIVEYSGLSQYVVEESYGNLVLSGSGTKVFSSGTTRIAGSLSVIGNASANALTNNSNIDYNGSGDQEVLAIDYYDLSMSNAGTKYFGAGTVAIGGDLDVRDLAVVDAITYNDTVKYFGTNKTVRYGFINKNLKISDDCAVTFKH